MLRTIPYAHNTNMISQTTSAGETRQSKKLRILIDMLHPGDPWFFTNVIDTLEKEGHSILITSREKDVTSQLLRNTNRKFVTLTRASKGGWPGIIAEAIIRELKLLKIAIRFKPHIITGLHDPFVAHVGFITGKTSVVFSDSEHQKIMERITFPFSTKVCVGTSYTNKSRSNWLRYAGYHELAYLHPTYFKPDKRILLQFGLQMKKFILVRLVSWDAHHDFGEKGISDPIALVKNLAKIHPVVLVSEKAVPDSLKKYVLNFPPEKIHHLMYFAKLYIGEGATMASEAVVLGTPAVYVNTLRLGYIDEQEKKYGLLKQFNRAASTEEILKTAKDLIRTPNIVWRRRRQRLLNDKTDVTSYVLRLFKHLSRR